MSGSCTLKGSDHTLRAAYGALTRASEKDQDRFLAVPQGSAGLLCGIFDGHSVHTHDQGKEQAEFAALHVAGDFWKRVGSHVSQDVQDRPDAASAPVPQPGESDVARPGPTVWDAATECFVAHQERMNAHYHENVAAKARRTLT